MGSLQKSNAIAHLTCLVVKWVALWRNSGLHPSVVKCDCTSDLLVGDVRVCEGCGRPVKLRREETDVVRADLLSRWSDGRRWISSHFRGYAMELL